MFKDFIKRGEVREGSPDHELSKSLIKIGKLRMRNLEKENITDENSFSVVEDSYEAVKELIDALMALRGYKSYSHEASIEFLNDFYSNKVPAHIINRIDRYRKIRNDIKYRGLLTTKEEGNLAMKEMKEAFLVIISIFNKMLKNQPKA